MGGVSVICLACNGAGEQRVDGGTPDESWIVCDVCNGTGEVEEIEPDDSLARDAIATATDRATRRLRDRR